MYVKNRSGFGTTGGRHHGVRTLHLYASGTPCASPTARYRCRGALLSTALGYKIQTASLPSRSRSQSPLVKLVPRKWRVPGGQIGTTCSSGTRPYSWRVASLSVKYELAPVTVPSSGEP